MILGAPPRSEPAGAASAPVGYYGVPAIHRSHWNWLIVGYFFLGGISGSAAAISAFTRVFGKPGAERMAHVATCVSIVTLAPCPFLLILDLGRPRRFLNMVRAFRPRSPMSMGTWGLGAFSVLLALDALVQANHALRGSSTESRPGSVRAAERTLSALTGAGGLFVAGYTGVLLAATAVPLWCKRPALLGPLVLSAAMSSGSAAVSAAAVLTGNAADASEEALSQLEMAAALAEGTLLVAWLRSLGPTAQPLHDGLLGYVVRGGAGAVGIAAPFALNTVARFLPRRARRGVTLAASLLTLAGALAFRYALVEGGHRSADDPLATFEMTG
jgi:formate-dependent nitrite reductase membrane component NrfD